MMLLVTAVGLILGVAAIALLPFTKHHDLGRRIARIAIVIGVVSPLWFFMDLGAELARVGRLVLMSPILLGVIAMVLYPKKSPELRGFEVLPAKDQHQDEQIAVALRLAIFGFR